MNLQEMMNTVELQIIKGKTGEVDWANRVMLKSQIAYMNSNEQEQNTVLKEMFYDREDEALMLYKMKSSSENGHEQSNVARIMNIDINESRATEQLGFLIRRL